MSRKARRDPERYYQAGENLELDDSEYGPSKSQVKRDLAELRELGEKLAELPPARLDQIVEMEERLRDAFATHRRLPSFEAKRRQMQFISKMLRDFDDVEPFRLAIARHRQTSTRSLEQAETWRERLLTEDDATTAWAAAFPGELTPALRSLLRKALQERDEAVAKAAPGDKPKLGHYYRELFQALKQVIETALIAQAEALSQIPPPSLPDSDSE